MVINRAFENNMTLAETIFHQNLYDNCIDDFISPNIQWKNTNHNS